MSLFSCLTALDTAQETESIPKWRRLKITHENEKWEWLHNQQYLSCSGEELSFLFLALMPFHRRGDRVGEQQDLSMFIAGQGRWDLHYFSSMKVRCLVSPTLHLHSSFTGICFPKTLSNCWLEQRLENLPNSLTATEWRTTSIHKVAESLLKYIPASSNLCTGCGV